MVRAIQARSLMRLLVIGILVLALTACGSTLADGTPTPATGSTVAASATGASPGAATEITGQRSITVNGVGIVTVTPDTAKATIGATATESTVAKALTDVDQKVTAIVSVLHDHGIDDAQIQTTQFSVNVNYDYNQSTRPVTGYTVTHLLRFSVSPAEKVGAIIGDAVDAGANQISSITFTTADPTSATQQARDLAVSDALTRAQQYAQSAKVELGAPISISESSVATPVVSETATGGMGASPVKVETGQQQIEVDVVVSYAIK